VIDAIFYQAASGFPLIDRRRAVARAIARLAETGAAPRISRFPSKARSPGS